MFTRDFVYLAVSSLQVILAACVTPILTRRLDTGEFGQLALAVAVMQILGPIFSFGLPFATQKVFAGEDGDRQARGVLAVSVPFAVVALMLVVLTAPAWAPLIGLYSVLDARLAALWGACFALTWTCLAMLRSKEKLGIAIGIGGLQSLGAQALGVTLLFVWSPDIGSYLCGVIACQGAAALVGVIALRPDWSALVAIGHHRRAFAFGLPMVPQQLSVFILFAGDRIVVRHDIGSAATGRYSVAYNVGSLGVLFLVFVNQAWIPRIYAVADRLTRSRLLANSRDIMSLLLVPVVCGLAVAAPVVLRLWAPRSFAPAGLAAIVAIVATATFPYGQFLSNVRALMSEGMTGRVALMTAVGAVVNIALNIVMVPLLGITGSAIATVLSYALLARLTRPPVRSGLRVPGMSRQSAILIGGGLALALGMAALPTSNTWLAIRLAVCCAAALAFVLLLRGAGSGLQGSGRLVARFAGGVGQPPQ
ncbi:MAG: lipopolysaccharide biosynthesis protein [Solirubrobacteraceae bacterium]